MARNTTNVFVALSGGVDSSAAAATVTPDAYGAVVEFDEPIAAITPGQLTAFYAQ